MIARAVGGMAAGSKRGGWTGPPYSALETRCIASAREKISGNRSMPRPGPSGTEIMPFSMGGR